jgi:hypothetical protein
MPVPDAGARLLAGADGRQLHHLAYAGGPRGGKHRLVVLDDPGSRAQQEEDPGSVRCLRQGVVVAEVSPRNLDAWLVFDP